MSNSKYDLVIPKICGIHQDEEDVVAFCGLVVSIEIVDAFLPMEWHGLVEAHTRHHELKHTNHNGSVSWMMMAERLSEHMLAFYCPDERDSMVKVWIGNQTSSPIA